MKKILYFLTSIVVMFFAVNTNVKATNLTCVYDNELYLTIEGLYKGGYPQVTYTEDGTVAGIEGFSKIIFGRFFSDNNYPNKEINDQEEINWLKKFRFLSLEQLSNKYVWDCPYEITYTEGNKKYTITLTEEPIVEGDVYFDYMEDLNESYVCNYLGSEGNLSLNYTEDENGYPVWNVVYPDGYKEILKYDDINGKGYSFPSKECEDIYYVKKNRIIVASFGNNQLGIDPALKNLCRNYSDNEIYHYCSGKCEMNEIRCSDVSIKYKHCGTTTEIPAALPTFIHNIITIIKIFIPIMLIILGMIDFAKAIVTNDEKVMNNSKNTFIKRIIAAISVFLIIAITQFIFSAIGGNDANNMISCINCFINNICM